MAVSVLCLTILSVLALAGPGLAKKRPEKGDPGFDLFVFVRSYSPTYCRLEACSIRPITAFTIHGLWPNYNNGGWPQYCDADRGNSGASADGGSGRQLSAALSEQQLHRADAGGVSTEWEEEAEDDAALMRAAGGWQKKHKKKKKAGGGESPQPQPQPQPSPQPQPQPSPEPDPDPPGPGGEPSKQQKCEWPSFRGPDASFWDHEWDKHGTCARPLLGDRPAFFNATMRLHEQYDLDVALAAAGIVPSNSTSYSTTRLLRAVEDAFGVMPLVSCYHGQLLELWLCVGLDLRVRQCPPGVVKAQHPSCTSKISLPEGSAVPADCRPFFPPWKAPPNHGRNIIFVRVLTGLVAAGAGAAAVALFVRAISRGRRRSLADAFPEAPYDALQSWCPPKPRSLE